MRFAIACAMFALMIGCDLPVEVAVSTNPEVNPATGLPTQTQSTDTQPASGNGGVIAPARFSRIHGETIDRTWTGRVVGVTDGDTITVLDGNNQQQKIRLAGIDAPETRGQQPFGQAAKQHLSSLVFDRQIEVYQIDVDRYGRIVAYLGVDGEDICGGMVWDGYAWEYAQYSKSDELSNYQREAKAARRGLWAGTGADDQVPPWEWRKR